MRFNWLVLMFISTLAVADTQPLLTAAWAENYLKSHDSHLLDDSDHDHVMSLYYFGHYKNRSLMGLERVRGENYEQFYTLLVFENQRLLGYYTEILSFPASLDEAGDVNFPLGIEGRLETRGQPLNIGLGRTQFSALCLHQKNIRQCYPWHAFD